MPYDVITIQMRTPAAFNTYAFTTAIQRLLWDKIGCDRATTGVLCYNTEPDPREGASIFAFIRVEILVRAEAGKVPMKRFSESLEKYLRDTVKYTVEQAWIVDVTTANDVHRSEL